MNNAKKQSIPWFTSENSQTRLKILYDIRVCHIISYNNSVFFDPILEGSGWGSGGGLDN